MNIHAIFAITTLHGIVKDTMQLVRERWSAPGSCLSMDGGKLSVMYHYAHALGPRVQLSHGSHVMWYEDGRAHIMYSEHIRGFEFGLLLLGERCIA